MFTNDTRSAQVREREGLRSSVLLEAGSAPDSDLSVTWVEVAPGARQELHSHDPEQVYVVVEGEGEMQVGSEERHLGRGELAFIPGGARHGIRNTGERPLVYVSAATPAFAVTEVYDSGELS